MRKMEYYLSRIAPLSEFSTGRVRAILKTVASVKEEKGRIKSLLDIGCSDGSLTILVNEVLEAKEVYGIEISPAAAEQAEKLFWTPWGHQGLYQGRINP